MGDRVNSKEGNKAIAEFVGIDETIPHDHMGIYCYNTSWDWLIPVIKKIKFLKEYRCNIHRMHMLHHLMELDIDKCYVSVVRFIQGYNKNNKPS